VLFVVTSSAPWVALRRAPRKRGDLTQAAKATAAAHQREECAAKSWLMSRSGISAATRSGRQASSSHTAEVGNQLKRPRILWVAELFAQAAEDENQGLLGITTVRPDRGPTESPPAAAGQSPLIRRRKERFSPQPLGPTTNRRGWAATSKADVVEFKQRFACAAAPDPSMDHFRWSDCPIDGHAAASRSRFGPCA